MKQVCALFFTLILATAIQSCTDSRLTNSEALIDAFYSFDPTQLEPLLVNAQSSIPSLMYYQGWAEGGNYKIINRSPCITSEANVVTCAITVEDDPIMALGIDFKVTDTFHITIEDDEITQVETSSNDPDIYYDAADWVRANFSERVAQSCQGHFDGGPTPGDCARLMAEGYGQFRESNDFPEQYFLSSIGSNPNETVNMWQPLLRG